MLAPWRVSSFATDGGQENLGQEPLRPYQEFAALGGTIMELAAGIQAAQHPDRDPVTAGGSGDRDGGAPGVCGAAGHGGDAAG